MTARPIFVHSLFRSGSTYVFGAFRRSAAGYWCYQEPLNEFVRHVADAPHRLLEIDAHDRALLRHPTMDKPYFWEFYQIRDAIAPLFRKEFSYDTFFTARTDPSFPALKSYLQCLIDNARGRPLLQCCRSFGRIAALRDAFAGTHIHLWRNPHDQWWSYQVGDYFDATTQLILNAADTPPILAAVKEICGVLDFHDRDVESEIAHARRHRLASRESYLSFYALWMYSFLQSEKVADLSINIDSLSTSNAYRQHILASLANQGIDALDFSDCSSAQAQFSANDIAFFTEAEERVHALFQIHSPATGPLEPALMLRAEHKPAAHENLAELAESATRARRVALREIDTLAATQRQVAGQQAMLAESHKVAETRGEELALARAQLVQLEGDIQRVQVQLQASENEVSNRRAQLTAKSEELSDATFRLGALGNELAAMQESAEQLQNEAIKAGARIEELNRDVNKWWAMADGLDRHLKAVYATRSWRVTAPLRRIAAALKI